MDELPRLVGTGDSRSASALDGRSSTCESRPAPSRGVTATPAHDAAADPEPPAAYVPPPRAPDLAAIKALSVPIIEQRLYFTSLSTHPTSTDKARFFTVDYDLHYSPYFADFGPLNAAMLIRFCRALRDRLNQTTGDTEIFFYSGHSPHVRANAGYLIFGFAVLVLNMHPEEVEALTERAYPPLLPFRDASYGIAAYQLTVVDVARALHKAKQLGWIDIDTFDADEYERFDAVTCGDWNWIIPGKFIAFSSPLDGVPGREPKMVLQPFRQRNVQLVVRLNEKRYDRRSFTEVGIRHEELQYPDGSTPPDTIVRAFLDMCESQKGVVAVHCKAGLGRTGSLISVFMMKHFGLTSRESIAWCRVCRPGCVIGPQQQYLDSMQRRLDAAGEVYRRAATRDAAPVDPLFEATLSRTMGPCASVKLAMAGATNSSRPSTRGGNGAAGSSDQQQQQQQQQGRAASPAQRSRPKPLKLIENLPFDVPMRDTQQRVMRLQALVEEGDARAEAETDAPTDPRGIAAATAPGVAKKPAKGAAMSGTGVSRPVAAPGAATFVAGVTGSKPDQRLVRALRA